MQRDRAMDSYGAAALRQEKPSRETSSNSNITLTPCPSTITKQKQKSRFLKNFARKIVAIHKISTVDRLQNDSIAFARLSAYHLSFTNLFHLRCTP